MQWKKGDECRVRRPARGTRDGEFLDGIVIKVNPKTIWVRYKIKESRCLRNQQAKRPAGI